LKAGADEVIVFADATSDGSCDKLPAGTKVLRSASPVGCGTAKTLATQAAEGDALMWVDAHQTVEAGDLRAFAQKAVGEDAVMCPPLVNVFYDEQWVPHRVSNDEKKFYPSNSALLPSSGQQYRFEPEGHQAAVGVGLCMSRNTYRKLGGWNRYRGRHGSQERGMSLRAFMAGVQVRMWPDLVLGHEFYGEKHPSRNSSTKQYQFNNLVSTHHNLWHAYQTVLSQPGFKAVMAPWLESLEWGVQGKAAMQDSEALLDRDYFLRHCKRRTDDELFEFLSGLTPLTFAKDKGGASLEPAAVHFIKAHAVGRCLELGTGSGKGTLSLLEGAAKVVSVDHMAQYTNAAKASVKDPRAVFHTAGIKGNGFYDLSFLEGKFDLIVIDGPPGTKARRFSIEECLPHLAFGGTILVDDAKRDIEGVNEAVVKHDLDVIMLPTSRGMAKITPRHRSPQTCGTPS
jgi:SAM-dependent methyltransferase